MKINCVIIDDEPLAVDLLKGYVERTPMLHLIETYNSAVDALPYLRSEQVDLLFLDINMPGLNGLEFAKLLPSKIRIVYTTAYSEYAIDSYKVRALDYLLKPISYECFLESIEKAMQYFQTEMSQITQNTKVYGDDEDIMFVKSEYKLIRVNKKEILFVEGLKDYIKIYTTTQPKPILTLTSMHTMEKNLNRPYFLRVHRSFIVNMQYVTHYERGKIVFGKHEIQVSDSGKDRVKEYINQRLVNK